MGAGRPATGSGRDAAPEAFRSLLQRRFGEFVGRVEVEGPTFVYPLALQLAESLADRFADRLAVMGDGKLLSNGAAR